MRLKPTFYPNHNHNRTRKVFYYPKIPKKGVVLMFFKDYPVKEPKNQVFLQAFKLAEDKNDFSPLRRLRFTVFIDGKPCIFSLKNLHKASSSQDGYRYFLESGTTYHPLTSSDSDSTTQFTKIILEFFPSEAIGILVLSQEQS